MPKLKKTPQQKMKEQTTIRLPAELKKKLQQEADRRGESFNGFVMTLINKGLEVISYHQ